MASAPTANGGSNVAEYDLMLKLVQHLDRHMIFPLLEFNAGQLVDEESGDVKDEAKAREITQAKYALLKKTNMTDYVANLYCELEGLKEPPAEFADKKQRVFSQLQRYEQETSKIIELLERDDVVNNLRSDKVANLEFLKREHEVGLSVIGNFVGLWTC
jgi:translation initiation factor 3 subunit E